MRLFYMHLSITAQLITLELLKRTCTQKVKTRFSGHTWKLTLDLLQRRPHTQKLHQSFHLKALIIIM